MENSAVEWLVQKTIESGLIDVKNGHKFLNLQSKAKEMEKKQRGYSKEDVREMLFMALYESQEECCTTHTKDSIVRKVLKTFKSE